MNELCKGYLNDIKAFDIGFKKALKQDGIAEEKIPVIEKWYRRAFDIKVKRQANGYKYAYHQARYVFFEGLEMFTDIRFSKDNANLLDTYMLYKEISEMLEEAKDDEICDMYKINVDLSPISNVENYIFVSGNIKRLHVFEIDEVHNTIEAVTDQAILDKVNSKYKGV